MAHQLKLGVPSLAGKAARNEALSVFGSNFPLALWLTNQTPSKHFFPEVDARLIPHETVPVDFSDAETLDRMVNNLNQLSALFGFEDSFILSDTAPAVDEPASAQAEVEEVAVPVETEPKEPIEQVESIDPAGTDDQASEPEKDESAADGAGEGQEAADGAEGSKDDSTKADSASAATKTGKKGK